MIPPAQWSYGDCMPDGELQQLACFMDMTAWVGAMCVPVAVQLPYRVSAIHCICVISRVVADS